MVSVGFVDDKTLSSAVKVAVQDMTDEDLTIALSEVDRHLTLRRPEEEVSEKEFKGYREWRKSAVSFKQRLVAEKQRRAPIRKRENEQQAAMQQQRHRQTLVSLLLIAEEILENGRVTPSRVSDIKSAVRQACSVYSESEDQ